MLECTRELIGVNSGLDAAQTVIPLARAEESSEWAYARWKSAACYGERPKNISVEVFQVEGAPIKSIIVMTSRSAGERISGSS